MKQFGNGKINLKIIAQYLLASAVIVAAGIFFYLEFKKNWDTVRAYHFAANFYYIFASIFVTAIGFIINTYIWHIFVNDYLPQKLKFRESFALYNATAMLKYVPGKIWLYAAQVKLMSPRGISKTLLMYINLICFICLIFASAIYTLYYYLIYLKMASLVITISIFALLLILYFVFVIWNIPITNYFIIPVNKIFKREIQPLKMRKPLLLYIQLLYLLSYIPVGIGMYFLAKGIGMDIPIFNIMAIMATLSVSIVLGYVAFFTPGGLGVREGAMFFMLKQFSNIDVALILPIVMRLIYIIIELMLGITGILIGMKTRFFRNDGV
jgi:glycosyltransferase 2 family protein